MKENIKELTEGMQRLCAIANRIVSHQEEVSQIEKDLLLEDLRRLYDVALHLCDDDVPAEREMGSKDQKEEMAMPDEEILSSTVMATMAAMGVGDKEVRSQESGNTEEVEAEPKAMPQMEELEANENSLLFDEVIIEEAPEVQPANTTKQTPVVEASVEEKPAVVESVSEEPASEEPVVEVPVSEEAIVKESVAEESASEAPAVEEPVGKAGTQASLLDYLKRPVEEKPTVRTLGDSLGEGIRNSEIGIQNREKVSDLRTVININDKFSFMSELFHNNMKAYNDFILRLNSIDTRDEALLCVNEVSTQYKWDENSLAVQSFYKVFDKKF